MADDPFLHVVAIDGPAAAGKSTVARLLAERLPALLFDTGSLYRALTLAALERGMPVEDGAGLARLAERIDIHLAPASVDDGRLADVLLDGRDVSWAIREPEIDATVSAVARHPEVRASLLPHQRRIAASGPVVMVGRDIGTVVVPTAGLKIYLDATPEERARRRVRDRIRLGEPAEFEEVLTDILRRDQIDRSRKEAPLRAAEDAVIVGTDGKEIGEVVAEIERLARGRWRSPASTAGPAAPGGR